MIAKQLITFSLMVGTIIPCGVAHAQTSGSEERDIQHPIPVTLGGAGAIRYVPFTLRDVVTGAPSTTTYVTLNDGRMVNVQTYLRELNAAERELSAFGASLRSSQSNLGTVARSQAPMPSFHATHPGRDQQNSDNSGWNHSVNHPVAAVNSAGRITQSHQTDADGMSFERTTTHSVDGRFLDTRAPSIAQFTQRVVRTASGEEFRETQVYLNGRQVFRRGRSGDQEARIWKTAFDVPLKSITVPVGPGSIEAKIGIRGGVNLDLNVAPANTPNAFGQMALDFMPHVLTDAYVSAQTTPTNIGDAGFEGALTLADNTLKIVGTIALSRAKIVDMKHLTIDNTFAGFKGRLFGFANVQMPGRSADGKDKKHFEKEFYAWDGIKVEKRLYEYKAPDAPQPPTL